jgi:RimJ/RimL family protein N-acetyltransferase
MDVPRLETRRLVLRAFEARDFEPYAQNFLNPDSNRFLPGAQKNRRTAFQSFTSALGQWALTGTGWWMLELRESRAPIGSVGAFYRESALGRLESSDLEVGWNVFRPHWRNGYATEAARAALDWALRTRKPPRVIAYIDKENVASVRVAEAIGLRFTEEASFYGEPVGLWSNHGS